MLFSCVSDFPRFQAKVRVLEREKMSEARRVKSRAGCMQCKRRKVGGFVSPFLLITMKLIQSAGQM
jgi:hypothetical protein